MFLGVSPVWITGSKRQRVDGTDSALNHPRTYLLLWWTSKSHIRFLFSLSPVLHSLYFEPHVSSPISHTQRTAGSSYQTILLTSINSPLCSCKVSFLFIHAYYLSLQLRHFQFFFWVFEKYIYSINQNFNKVLTKCTKSTTKDPVVPVYKLLFLILDPIFWNYANLLLIISKIEWQQTFSGIRTIRPSTFPDVTAYSQSSTTNATFQ